MNPDARLIGPAIHRTVIEALIVAEEVEQARADDALAQLEPADLAELARWVEELRELRRNVADAEHTLEAMLAEAMPKSRMTLDDHGLALERRQGNRYTEWDDARCAGRVAAVAVARREPDPETGEVADTADTVVKAMLAAARPAWRVTSLRNDFGIDPETYCRVEAGRPSVQVRKYVAP